MHVYGDQSFIFQSFSLVQVLGGLLNQKVENVQELVVGLPHHLLILSAAQQCILSISGPEHLNTKYCHLSLELAHHVQEIELIIIDEHVARPDDSMNSILRIEMSIVFKIVNSSII